MKKILTLLAASLLFTGCASVNVESQTASSEKKAFVAPAAGQAGLYIFREGILGAALKKDVLVDGKCIGETAPNVFFYTEVEGGKSHKIETESEFSANALELFTEAGKNYFVRQYIKVGFFVGGANIEQVTEAQGKAAIMPLAMGQQGRCGDSPQSD